MRKMSWHFPWREFLRAAVLMVMVFAGMSGSKVVTKVLSKPEFVVGTRLIPCKWNGKDSFIDTRDNRSYRQVQIGGQCWMAQNLYHGKVVPNMEQSANGIAECTCQGNDPKNCELYGGLYSWDEAMNHAPAKEGAAIQGLCPDGWHLPSDAEWRKMEAFLDPTAAAPGESWRGNQLAHRLIGAQGAWAPTAVPESSVGFDALPAGSAVSGWFFYLGRGAYFWTSSPYSAAAAWSRGILSQTGQVFRGPGDKLTGYSVRCIKDA